MENGSVTPGGDNACHSRTDGGSRLVLVGAVEDDRSGNTCFGQFPWRIFRIAGVREFAGFAEQSKPRVVVCEDRLHDGNWQDILGVIAAMRNPPPLIVTSRLADERLWAEVLNLGGYDLLAKPLSRTEVRRAVNLAWGYTFWRHQLTSARCVLSASALLLSEDEKIA